MNKIIRFLFEIVNALFSKKVIINEPPAQIEEPVVVPKLPREHLYDVAYSFLDVDASPQDFANDEYGCAESVSCILRAAFPEDDQPIIVSTITMFKFLRNSLLYMPVDKPEYGDIIISVTGTGNGNLSNGHVGIVGKHRIMSNNSKTGTWDQYFTLDSWNRYYRDFGGMRSWFFRRVGQ